MESRTWYNTQTGKKLVSYKKNAVIPEGYQEEKPDTTIAIETRNKAFDSFITELKKGFTYKDVVYQCERDDVDLWTRGLTLAKRHNMTTVLAICKNNQNHTLSLAGFEELVYMAEDTYWERWRTYQDIKTGVV